MCLSKCSSGINHSSIFRSAGLESNSRR
jgi:hypothetical protein